VTVERRTPLGPRCFHPETVPLLQLRTNLELSYVRIRTYVVASSLLAFQNIPKVHVSSMFNLGRTEAKNIAFRILPAFHALAPSPVAWFFRQASRKLRV
jgi:hypothetical protein